VIDHRYVHVVLQSEDTRVVHRFYKVDDAKAGIDADGAILKFGNAECSVHCWKTIFNLLVMAEPLCSSVNVSFAAIDLSRLSAVALICVAEGIAGAFRAADRSAAAIEWYDVSSTVQGVSGVIVGGYDVRKLGAPYFFYLFFLIFFYL
jgi:hypothetical protein